MNAKNISVIAVDDDEGMRGLLERAFAGAGSFRSYSSADDFLAGARLDSCDIVFMDINIPGGQDGLSLTRHIKRVAPQCDVVVMTGEATLDNVLAAMKAGAYDFLRKPFSVDHMEAVVDRCVEKRRMSSELKLLKEAQEELSAAYSQLKSSERIKEAFLSVIGHELRTPLAKILAGTDLLRGGMGEHRDEILNAVSSGATDLQAVIESLILYAELRKEAAPGKFSEVNLKAVSASVLEELKAKAAEAGVSLSLRCPGGDGLVRGEPEWIRNAIKRLVQNAVVYNVRGGSAVLSVEDGPASVTVTVADSGIGIPESLVAGLGTPFYQIADYMTRKTGGLGLGLAIVKQVVEAHNGKMSLKNSGGGGTEFSLTFLKKVPAGPALPRK